MNLGSFGRSDPRWLVMILVLSALAAVVLSVAAWFVLPLLAIADIRPFESEASRLGVLLVIALAWGATNAVLRARRNDADQARLDALDRQDFETRTEDDTFKHQVDDEFAAIRTRARKAFENPRRRWIDIVLQRQPSVPRYIVMGPRGSGKTSILSGADLTLSPHSREEEADKTSACRFVVSDGAVFIEVSGDLSLGAGHRKTSLWPRLLELLRGSRPSQPVNGVILVVAAADLANVEADERLGLARSLRAQLDAIVDRMRTRVPVYLMLSKLDQLSGFGEFFEHLDVTERAQVWGVALESLEEMTAPQAAPAAFGTDFVDLVKRTSTRQISLLHSEPDPARRMLAFEFPAQLAALRDGLVSFLEQVLQPNRFNEPPFLRGVFLSSALQDGTRIDMIGGPLTNAFAFATTDGAPSQRLERTRPESRLRRRAYFLKHLFSDVILAEAGRAGLTRKARLAGIVRHYAIRGAAIAILLLGFVHLWSAYGSAGLYVNGVMEAADRSNASLGKVTQSPDAANFGPALAALNNLAALAAAADDRVPKGFNGVDAVRDAAETAYREGLTSLLLPLTLRSVERRLADPASLASVRFQCLKLYLLLGSGRSPSPELMADLGPELAADWLVPSEDPVGLQQAESHLVALASVPIAAQSIDKDLVAEARRLLDRTNVAQIGYQILRHLPALRALRPWRPIDHAGSLGPQALARTSGAPLSDGIQGGFTAAGIGNVIAAAGTVSDQISADSWVFGADSAQQPNLSARAVRAGMLELYRADYIRVWEALLSDLTVPPMPTASVGAETIAILNGPESPILELLTSVAAETDPDQGLEKNIAQRALAKTAVASNASVALSDPTVAAQINGPRQEISRHFAKLREALKRPKDGQGSAVDSILKALDHTYRQLLLIAAGATPEPPTMGPGIALTLEAIKRLPLSIQPYFTHLANDTTGLLKVDARGRAAQLWAASVQPACEAAIAKVFPFDRSAKLDMPLDEFTRVFSPNGLVADFRRTQLANLVNMSTRPWRWRDRTAAPSDPPDPTLDMFERADDITAAFFAQGDKPAVRFTLQPVRLDPAATSFQFDIGGASLNYAHGPDASFIGQWPPPIPDAPATLSVQPEVEGVANSLVGEGPWGLFRLVAQAKVKPAPNALLLAFSVGRRPLAVKLTTPTLHSPFDLEQMEEFRCPKF